MILLGTGAQRNLRIAPSESIATRRCSYDCAGGGPGPPWGMCDTQQVFGGIGSSLGLGARVSMFHDPSTCTRTCVLMNTKTSMVTHEPLVTQGRAHFKISLSPICPSPISLTTMQSEFCVAAPDSRQGNALWGRDREYISGFVWFV